MITTEDFKKISDKYGSPAYVFDEDELIGRVRAIKAVLGTIPLVYSIKANPFLIPALIDEIDRLEVCSPGELAICRHLNAPAAKIIYSGVHKDLWDIKEAIEYGAAILTCESVKHYELICEAAKDARENAVITGPVDVILRLTAGSQFGMSLEDIEKILKSRDDNVNIIGLHYFAGTGRKSAKKQSEELEMLTETLTDLRIRYGLELPMLEYGPGLPHPYFTDEDFSDTLAPLKELSDDLKKADETAHMSVEMGRFIASSCGYYMTSICDIKRSHDTNWCIVDGGINHINYYGQMMGMKVPHVSQYRAGKLLVRSGEADKTADGKQTEPYTIAGSLCTTNDILIRSLDLADPEEGDILIFENCGAYSVTEAMGLFLSRTLPRIVMFAGNDHRLVRNFVESWKINTWDSK